MRSFLPQRGRKPQLPVEVEVDVNFFFHKPYRVVYQIEGLDECFPTQKEFLRYDVIQ